MLSISPKPCKCEAKSSLLLRLLQYYRYVIHVGFVRTRPRDPSVICVVQEPKDLVAMERTKEFQGYYHVLQGAISPMEGIGPDEIHVEELLKRLSDER